MEEQITNIITILTALLTGGFLMLFIENQQITTYVVERLHQRMNPFFTVLPIMLSLFLHLGLVTVGKMYNFIYEDDETRCKGYI